MSSRTWPALEVALSDDPSDLFQAALTDYAVVAIDETAPGGWRVYFQDAAERDRAMQALRTSFTQLALNPLDVPDEDWAARSQASLRAIRIGNVTVAPPWDVPKPDAISPLTPGITVIIQPSMGFGTGHHATTRLCLAMMQPYDLHRMHVLDVGTGSGVLAIAASALGAPLVVGIDSDADAIQSARENLALNPDTNVDLRVVDLRATVLSQFDLVVANLTGALIADSAGRLQELVAPGGPLILSGFQKDDEAGVLAAFPALKTIDRSEEDVWVCVALRREGTFG